MISLKAKKWIFVGLVVFLMLGLGVARCFIFSEMKSSSMAPVIFGEGSSGRGDVVLVARGYPHRFLRPGDIVLVYLESDDGDPLTTFRAIRSVATNMNGALQFYVKGLTTNAIDSDTVGFISDQAVFGKAVWIFHRQR